MKSLTKGKMWLFAIGQGGYAILSGLIGSWLVYFYQPTQELVAQGQSALIPQGKVIFGVLTILGLIAAAGRIFDAVTDPLIASWSDKCKSKNGRRIPFLKAAALPLAVVTVLVFSAPFSAGSAANGIWVFAMVALYYFLITAYCTPFTALYAELGKTAEERMFLSTAMSLTFIVGTAFAYVAPALWDIFIGMGMGRFSAIRLAMTLLAGIATLAMFCPVFFIKETDYVEAKPVESTAMQSLAATFKNKDFRIFVGSDIFYWIGLTMFQTGLPFFVTTLMKLDEGWNTILFVGMTALSLVFYVPINFVTGKVGKKKPWISANGYYSREEFKEILKYAARRHITVIPEIDVPGHSSSAIEAMRHRARTTGDSSYLLTDDGDTSKFLAYQGFKDNVIDPGLPSTYKFLGHVFDDLKKIYSEAGFKLETVNISGDEVAEGCWLGSPACGQLMEEHGFSTTEQLWSYFLDKIIDMLAERNLKFAGYAEVLVGTDEETLDKMRKNSSFIIVWRPLDDPAELNHIAYEFADKGFRMLLSHADHTYMDNAYYKHKSEHGLDWGGTTTERYAYSYDPLNLFAGSEGSVPLLHPENIIGVEPMLWGDNIYDFETDCYLLFPKVYGLFERCWNATPGKDEQDFDHFYSIVANREIPHLDKNSILHRNVMKTYEGK